MAAAAVALAGVARGDIYLHFAWQAWHVWHWAGSGGALGPEWPQWPPRLLPWQAWRLETSTFVSRGKRCYLVTSTSTLRGRRGTW